MRQSPCCTLSKMNVAASAADIGALSLKDSPPAIMSTRKSSSLNALVSMPPLAMRSRAFSNFSALISLGSLPSNFPELIAIDVPMWPGITTDARSVGAFIRKSVIRASVKPLTANFAALYAVCAVLGPSDAQKPLTELVFTTCPNGAFRRRGRNARVL